MKRLAFYFIAIFLLAGITRNVPSITIRTLPATNAGKHPSFYTSTIVSLPLNNKI